MKRVLVSLLFVLACSRSKEPTPETSCGSLGGACSKEGDTCTPAPVGSGWSHMLSCHGGKWTEMEIAPLPTPATSTASASPEGRAQPAPRNLPKVDLSCSADADCTITSEELQDDAPRSYACCPGCTQRAVNAAWLKTFASACQAQPAPMCPPIGCAMPIVKAACKAHRCEIVTSKP